MFRKLDKRSTNFYDYFINSDSFGFVLTLLRENWCCSLLRFEAVVSSKKQNEYGHDFDFSTFFMNIKHLKRCFKESMPSKRGNKLLVGEWIVY